MPVVIHLGRLLVTGVIVLGLAVGGCDQGPGTEPSVEVLEDGQEPWPPSEEDSASAESDGDAVTDSTFWRLTHVHLSDTPPQAHGVPDSVMTPDLPTMVSLWPGLSGHSYRADLVAGSLALSQEWGGLILRLDRYSNPGGGYGGRCEMLLTYRPPPLDYRAQDTLAVGPVAFRDCHLARRVDVQEFLFVRIRASEETPPRDS